MSTQVSPDASLINPPKQQQQQQRKARQRQPKSVKAAQPQLLLLPSAAEMALVRSQVQKPKQNKKSVVMNKPALRGDGNYGAMLATAVASHAVRKGAEWLVNKGANWLGKLIGSGDYHSSRQRFKRNSLMAGGPPAIYSTANPSGFQRQREKLFNVLASTGFRHSEMKINPGTAFPWLKQVAAAFQRYKVHGMVFEFVKSINPYGGANVNGEIVLSTRYDPNLAPPANIDQAEMASFSERTTPNQNILMGVECAPETRPIDVLNVRYGALPSNDVAQFFDLCVFDLCQYGQADDTSLIGEIWVSYEIEFLMPFANSIGGDLIEAYSTVGTCSNTTAAGTGWTPDPDNLLQIAVSNPTASTLKIEFPTADPPGEVYRVTVFQALTAGNTIAAGGVTDAETGCVPYQVFRNSAGALVNAAINGGGVSYEYNACYFIQKTAQQASPAYIVISGWSMGAGTTGRITIVVSRWNNDVALSEKRMRAIWPGLFDQVDRNRALEVRSRSLEERLRQLESSVGWQVEPVEEKEEPRAPAPTRSRSIR